jgi:hypothetical protein
MCFGIIVKIHEALVIRMPMRREWCQEPVKDSVIFVTDRIQMRDLVEKTVPFDTLMCQRIKCL